MEDFFLNYTQKCTKSLIYTEDHLKVNIKVIVLVLGQENMQFSRLEMAHIQFIESHKTKLFLLHSYLWSDAWYCSRWPGDHSLASWILLEAEPGLGSGLKAAVAADQGEAASCYGVQGTQERQVFAEELQGPWVLQRGQQSCPGMSLAPQTSHSQTCALPGVALLGPPPQGWPQPQLWPVWHAELTSLRHTMAETSPFLWLWFSLLNQCPASFMRSLDHITYCGCHHKLGGDL